MIDISLSYSSYTVEKKKEEEEEVGASATIPPGFTYCCLVEVCLLAGSSRAMLCCVLSEHSPHTRRISEQPGQVRLYRLFPPRLPPMGAKRLDERGGDYYSSSLSLSMERERESQQRCCASKAGRTEMLGPGTYTRSLHYTHERRRPSPFSPGRDSALSLSLALSWTGRIARFLLLCVKDNSVLLRECVSSSTFYLFIGCCAQKEERRREERKSIWLFIRVGAVVYFSHHSTAAETTKEISIYRASAASAASRSNAIIPGRV